MVEEQQGTEAAIPVEGEVQTPTAEEQLKTLQDQVQALTSDKERLEGGYKGLQKTLSERDRESKKQADLENRIVNIQDTIELLATAVSSRGDVDNLEPSERQDILTQIRKKRDDTDTKRKQQETEEGQREYIQKADALYNRAKAAFANDDDAIEKVEDLLINGRLDRAEARVSKAEEKKEIPKKEDMETEEQRVDKLAQAKFNQLLEERGLLEEYSARPSASGSVQEAMVAYSEGRITSDEARKRGVVFS
tara:strand:+ start:11420 stop:12169 length:750 start_codon:yes stop_codon:yes gene_type:complete